jgi:hypothetical protein
MHTCMQGRMYVCMYVCMSVCMYKVMTWKTLNHVCMHMYIRIYMTCIDISKNSSRNQKVLNSRNQKVLNSQEICPFPIRIYLQKVWLSIAVSVCMHESMSSMYTFLFLGPWTSVFICHPWLKWIIYTGNSSTMSLQRLICYA